ncbi:MAG: hypothetical protein JJE30_08945 [Desulfuromonadales bacterium]|nr:hypothetical protein [Desulfuromonadales bacterium]
MPHSIDDALVAALAALPCDYVRECWKCGESFDADDAGVTVCPSCGNTRIVPYGERFSGEDIPVVETPYLVVVCSNCQYHPDPSEYEPFCSRCGHVFVVQGEDGYIPEVSKRVHGLIVDRFRVNCVCYGEQLRFDPIDEVMTSVFRCGQFQQRIDCIACPICSGCGQLRCTCGCLGIEIKVTMGRTIETVPLRKRIASGS